MDNSTHNEDVLLLRYLDGELTGAEKEEFEKRIAADKLLQEELQSLRVAREAIHSFGISQNVAKVHAQMMDELKAPVRMRSASRRIVQYSLAAAASVLLIFISIQAYIFFTLSPGKIFSDYYKSYELSITRSGGAEPSAIEKAYGEKRYSDVVVLSANSNEIEPNFLAAMSNLELKNYAAAIEGYKKVITLNERSNTSIFKDEAEYYLSLALLQNKNYTAALEYMQKIHDNPGHLYHEKISNRLLRKVKWLRWR
jgi:tetratricopeptide (TPR) repeat protein